MNTSEILTQNEINNLPPPPQEWIYDIKIQEITDLYKNIKILQEYCDMDIDENILKLKMVNIHERIKELMKLDIKQLKKEINRTKKSCGYYNPLMEKCYRLKLNQSRNGKITKKGLVKNLITSYYEILVIFRGDSFNKCPDYEKVIEYLVDLK